MLVVDDDELVARSIRRALARHDVRVSNSGREAVDLCLNGNFEVVLCDVMMDDFSGKDVFEALKLRRPGFEERLIFITGGAYTPMAMEFLKNVQNLCLEKPFDFQKLCALIDERIAKASH